MTILFSRTALFRNTIGSRCAPVETGHLTTYRWRANGTRTNRCPASPRMANLGSVTALNIAGDWGKGETQGTSCGGTKLDVLVNECENAAWRQRTRTRPTCHAVFATGLGILVYPSSQLPWISLLHSFKTRTRTPRFLVVKEERREGRKRTRKEAAASSSLEYTEALR